jgi:PIN domain nuclease of toxin-antitoxin system
MTVEHAESVTTLQSLHRDPFDRMLVAQALAEPLRLVSADERVLAYGVGFVDARV